MKLSLKQVEIVNHIDGAVLVQAGPGSGKTRVLIERVKHILLTKKRSRILALTFSNLAAEEMKSRLENDPFIEDYVDNVTVGTIHSFCMDLVQTRGNLVGLNNDMVLFENEEDRKSVLKEIFLNDPVLKKILDNEEKPSRFLSGCLRHISEQKKKFLSPEMTTISEPFAKIYKDYNQRLINQNALDFDDILFYAYRILTENSGVVSLYNSLYKYICIDEAQDLNYAQYEVIKALCGKSFNNILLVGDAKQSIYGFNGSDSSIMSDQFVRDFNPKVYYLNENYRSAKSIVRFANKLEHYDSTSNYVYEGELSGAAFADESVEAKFVVDKIEELIKHGHAEIEQKLTYDDFAIIARNKYVFSHVESLLKDKNIPYFYKKSNSGIENESDYIRSFELSMRIIINNKDLVHLKELNQLVQSTNSNIDTTLSSMEILKQIFANSKYKNLLPGLQILQEASEESFEFNKVISQIEKDMPVFDDEERYLVLNDIGQWKSHWRNYCRQIPRENRSLISFRNCISLGKTQDITSDHGVSLLTAHMSKGLQFEVVFIIGLSEGTFPDYRAVRSEGSQMEQEKNNMYVAVTRAKRLCYLTYPRNKVMPWGGEQYQNPSRFIKELIDNDG